MCGLRRSITRGNCSWHLMFCDTVAISNHALNYYLLSGKHTRMKIRVIHSRRVYGAVTLVGVVYRKFGLAHWDCHHSQSDRAESPTIGLAAEVCPRVISKRVLY